MKKLFGSIVAVALAMILCYTLLFAALADVANKTVVVTDLGDRVLFTITLTFSATDSTNDLTSKAISTYGLLPEGATVQFTADGETGRDVDFFMRGGNGLTLTEIVSYSTRTAWADFSADAANTTALYDPTIVWQLSTTLLSTEADSTQDVIAVRDLAFYSRYIVFEADGQTGNTATTGTNSTIIYLRMFKNPKIRLPNYSATTMTFSTT